GPVDRVVVRALGDGPATSSSILRIDGEQPIRPVPELSHDVLAIAADAQAATWQGIGYRTLDSSGEDLLLLPPGISCSLGDSEARAAEGAAIVVLSDGRLAISGGLGERGRATRRIAFLAPGAETVEVGSVEMANETAFGTATALSDGKWLVAGGALSAS